MRLNLDQIKPKLLMSVRVAGGHYKAAGNKWWPYNGRWKSMGQFWPINTTKPLILQKERRFWVVGAFSGHFPLSFSLYFTSKNTPKHIKTPLILLLSPKLRGSVLAPILSHLGSIPWI